VGYVAFDQKSNATSTADAQVPLVPGLPSAGSSTPAPGEALLPSGPAASKPATSASAGTPTSSATSGVPVSSAPVLAGESPPPVLGEGQAPIPGNGTVAPSVSTVPAATNTPAPPKPADPPSATMSYTSSRSTGTILISNPNSSPLDDWRLTLTVQDGNKLTASGPVSVSQSGNSVVITPSGSGGTVGAQNFLTFSFAVQGGAPQSCALDGRACN
jgi:hypothetical protein